MKTQFLSLLLILSVLVLPFQSFAVPAHFTHQGYIEESGNPLTGSVDVVFNLYAQETEGTALWTETNTITFDGGHYSVVLGTNQPLDFADFDGSELFLGITVDDNGEFIPRTTLSTIPYAIRASTAETLTSSDGQIVVDSDGNWLGTDISSLDESTLETYLTDNDYITRAEIANSVTTDALEVQSTATLNGTLDVAEATTLYSTLEVADTTTLNGTLDVGGATTIYSTLGVADTATLEGDLDVTGSITGNDTMDILGDASFYSNADIGGALTVGEGIKLGEDNSTCLNVSEKNGTLRWNSSENRLEYCDSSTGWKSTSGNSSDSPARAWCYNHNPNVTDITTATWTTMTGSTPCTITTHGRPLKITMDFSVYGQNHHGGVRLIDGSTHYGGQSTYGFEWVVPYSVANWFKRNIVRIIDVPEGTHNFHVQVRGQSSSGRFYTHSGSVDQNYSGFHLLIEEMPPTE